MYNNGGGHKFSEFACLFLLQKSKNIQWKEFRENFSGADTVAESSRDDVKSWLMSLFILERSRLHAMSAEGLLTGSTTLKIIRWGIGKEALNNYINSSWCDKKFTRRYHVLTHELTHSGEKPFVCFSRKHNFKNHQMRHWKGSFK